MGRSLSWGVVTVTAGGVVGVVATVTGAGVRLEVSLVPQLVSAAVSAAASATITQGLGPIRIERAYSPRRGPTPAPRRR